MDLETRVEIEANKPSRKKPIYAVNDKLRNYLRKHGREVKLPLAYNDLTRFSYSVPLKDKFGQPTQWESTSYDMREWEFLREALIHVYAMLKTEGDLSFAGQLDVARVDYCTFGNSNPFRIRIVNKFNDNYDHYYIKRADSSRVYGLELEHLLSPNRMLFFTDHATMVEEHIPGVPGDIFIDKWLTDKTTNKVRLAKEFVKFNERCFVRLLGDMRSYNFVVNITPDIEDFQYRIRAIDFDQQSYEGKRVLYLPQFFKENLPLVQTVMEVLNKESIAQYQAEERTNIAFRLASARYRLMDLFDIMNKDAISSGEKVAQLAAELAGYFNHQPFLQCDSMGKIVKANMKHLIQKRLLLVPRKKKHGGLPPIV